MMLRCTPRSRSLQSRSAEVSPSYDARGLRIVMAELQPPQPIIKPMSRTHDVEKLSGLGSRFAAFVAERHPFALPYAVEAFESAGLASIKGRDAVKLDAARPVLRRALAKALY